MKKIPVCVITAIIFVCAALTVTADGYIYNNFTVVDKAGYLTDDQIDEIAGMLHAVREKYNCDVAIYTEEYMSGRTAEKTADNLYDFTLYGYGDDCDGIMLYIADDTREYHFTTHGYGETAFNDDGLEYLENIIVPYLSDGDYYTAFTLYAEHTDELLEMARSGNPYTVEEDSTMFNATVIACALLIPLLIAKIKTNGKVKKMKTAVANNFASNYMKPGSMNITHSSDIYLYSTVTKTPKPKSTSGGHISSSGEHHGGRGGKF